MARCIFWIHKNDAAQRLNGALATDYVACAQIQCQYGVWRCFLINPFFVEYLLLLYRLMRPVGHAQMVDTLSNVIQRGGLETWVVDRPLCCGWIEQTCTKWVIFYADGSHSLLKYFLCSGCCFVCIPMIWYNDSWSNLHMVSSIRRNPSWCP